jgi:hypothetical protein
MKIFQSEFPIAPYWSYDGQPDGPWGRESAIPHDPAAAHGLQCVGRCSMTIALMVMWGVWAAFAVILTALYIYRSGLTRDEEDHVFLDDSFEQEKNQQAIIAARVNKIEPVIRVFRWLVIAMSAVVAIYYIRDIMVQLNIIH